MVGRVFVGVDLPEDARAALAAGVDGWLAGRPLPGRPVPPPNWHITFRFLGDVGDVEYDRLVMALDEADLGGKFRLSVGGFGAFPRLGKATVTWTGVQQGREKLGVLAESVEEACCRAGFGEDGRPFKGHITLSRIRPPMDISEYSGGPLEVEFEVSSVTVFRSHLGGGTWYERMEEFPLG